MRLARLQKSHGSLRRIRSGEDCEEIPSRSLLRCALHRYYYTGWIQRQRHILLGGFIHRMMLYITQVARSNHSVEAFGSLPRDRRTNATSKHVDNGSD